MGAEHRIQHEEKSKAQSSVEVGKPTMGKLYKLLNRQGCKCALSGIELTKDNLQVDHIRPFAQGGEDVMENIQIVDERINRMKGTLMNAEFIELCRLVAARNPAAPSPAD